MNEEIKANINNHIQNGKNEIVINKIRLSKKSSMPNLLSLSKNENTYSRLNKNKKRLSDIKKMNSTDSLYTKTFNLYKNNINMKTIEPGRIKILKIKTLNKTLKNNKNYELKTNPNESMEHKLLYEDIIKLKTKINKLKMELSFLKSLNRKKDDEIRELEKYKEDAKFFYGKSDNKFFFKKLGDYQEIIKLKNIYENIKIKLRAKKEINDSIINQIKLFELAEIKNKNEENIKLFKKKLEEYNELRKKNELIENEITTNDWIKTKYFENHKFLTELNTDYNKKIIKIEKNQENLDKLKEKYEKIKSHQNLIIRRNSSIKNDNNKLLNDKKNRQEYIMKQVEIQNQISLYETKTQNLISETLDKENVINNYITQINKENENNKNIFEYKPITEINPKEIENKQVTLYESLIQGSKKKQNEILEKIKELINKKINKENINNKIINIDNDNSQIFSNNNNINSLEINIEEKNERDKKNEDFIFLLNLLFDTNNITKDKIQNTLLNYKTENYYIGNLNEKNNFLYNLSSEILQTINNKNDINIFKEILLYLLENKYEGNKILFLNKIIDDIYILENKTKILFNKKEEKTALEKIKNIFSKNNNINIIISKLNRNKKNIISFEDLKSILKEEKIFSSEEKGLFQFFIYFLIKRKKNKTLKEFDIKNILDFLNNLNKKKEKDFITGLKNFLRNKNTNIETLLGKNDVININEFMNILSENKFKIDNKNIDIYCELQKYQTKDNSTNIKIDLLKKDLDKIDNI